MAYMVGADPVQLDDLAARMTAAAERLESIRARVGALLAHSHWDGRDADEFRHLWQHQLAPRLHSAAATTRAGATTVLVNAQQQRDVSGVTGTPGGAAFPAAMPHSCQDVPGSELADRLLGVLSRVALGAAAFGLLPEFARTARRLWMDNPLARRGVALVEGMFEHGRGAPLLNVAIRKLNPVFIAVDVGNLVNEFRRDPTSAATFNAGTALVLGVAAKLATPCLPLALGLSAVSVAHGFASVDGSQQHQEWLRGATIKQVAGVAAMSVPTEVFVEGANAAERAIDTVSGIKSGGLNGVPNYCK